METFTKSPISILEELCVKSGIKPVYKLEDVGVAGSPEFQAICAIVFQGKNYAATAKAKSKKLAKIEVANKILKEELRGVLNLHDPEIQKLLRVTLDGGGEGQEVVDGEEETILLVKDDVSDLVRTGNPIYDLEEFRVKNGLPESEYSDGPKTGPSHNPILSVICKISNLEVRGVQSTKKVAKKIAAEKMLLELQKQLRTTGNFSVPREEEHDSQSMEVDNENEKYLKLLDAATENPDVLPAYKKLRSWTDYVASSYDFPKKGPTPFDKYLDKGSVKELVEFTRTVNEKYPLTYCPIRAYQDWLNCYEGGGAEGFFKKLEADLEFTVSWEMLKHDEQEEDGTFMLVMLVDFKDPKLEPMTTSLLVQDVEEGKMGAMVRFVMFLGLTQLV